MKLSEIVLLFLCGILLTMTAVSIDKELKEKAHKQQILEQCEKDLPRNQSCVIIAVPKAN